MGVCFYYYILDSMRNKKPTTNHFDIQCKSYIVPTILDSLYVNGDIEWGYSDLKEACKQLIQDKSKDDIVNGLADEAYRDTEWKIIAAFRQILDCMDETDILVMTWQ